MSTGSRPTIGCGSSESSRSGSTTTSNGVGCAARRSEYNMKKQRKLVRILTVLAYVISVSFLGLLLSAYYLFLWKPAPRETSEKNGVFKLAQTSPSTSEDYLLDWVEPAPLVAKSFILSSIAPSPKSASELFALLNSKAKQEEDEEELEEYGSNKDKSFRNKRAEPEDFTTFTQNRGINPITRPYQTQQIPIPQSLKLASTTPTSPEQEERISRERKKAQILKL